MITRSVQPSPPLAADGAALARVLHQAGVAKDSLIWVTGPAGLAVLIWLGREGYHQASYAHANRIAAMGAAVEVRPRGLPTLEEMRTRFAQDDDLALGKGRRNDVTIDAAGFLGKPFDE